MNWVGAGRKMVDDSSAGVASAATIRTGAAETVCVLTPAWAVEQIEQEWRAVFSLSGCEWTACTVPIANTSNTQSAAVVLATTLRFAHMLCMTSLWFGVLLILNLNDDLGHRRYSETILSVPPGACWKLLVPSGRLVGRPRF